MCGDGGGGLGWEVGGGGEGGGEGVIQWSGLPYAFSPDGDKLVEWAAVCSPAPHTHEFVISV